MLDSLYLLVALVGIAMLLLWSGRAETAASRFGNAVFAPRSLAAYRKAHGDRIPF